MNLIHKFEKNTLENSEETASSTTVVLLKDPKAKKTKKKTRKLKKLKLIILKYFDPIKSHRFYGDFVIPDKLWKYEEESLYSFTLYREYKVVRELHIRKHGIIIEFEDFDVHNLSPIGLIQSRLMSLGDASARELAEFLEKCENLFKKKEEKKEESIKTNEINCKSFEWMDELFE